MTLTPGDAMPSFSLPIDGDETLSSDDLKGSKTVIYFYPKDDTPGCTTEAQGFRDLISEFEAAGTRIVGVSKDTVKKHDKFKAKHDLPFALISDADGTLCEDFGVWVEKSMYGKKFMGIERATFLFDASGKLAEHWRKVKVKGHVDAVLEAAKGLG